MPRLLQRQTCRQAAFGETGLRDSIIAAAATAFRPSGL